MPDRLTERSAIHADLGSRHIRYVRPASIHISTDDVGSGVSKPIPRGLYEVEVCDGYSHIRP